MATCASEDGKSALHRQLVSGREALEWKLLDLSEFEVRQPMTPTGTNLLGLYKHVAGVAGEYFGRVFDRPLPYSPRWLADDAPPNSDMYAAVDESRDDLIAAWRAAWAHADRTIEELTSTSPGYVPWWPTERRHVTLLQVLAHMNAELHRHVGHADVVRELIDGAAGLRDAHSNLPDVDKQWWSNYVASVRASAEAHR